MFSISFETLTKGEQIGAGGFGIVYKGTYQFGPAAIKQLHVDNLSLEAEEEFNKEATIMAQLHHPNVVHFYGYCTVPKCLVMEYMPKGSLFSVLHDKRESLDWGVRMRIAMDMASGLAFLHSKNILHRDIKSLNVLLDSQTTAKLTDFGLSQVKNETKSQTTATKTSKDSVGTVQWMAPELFKRRAVYTQKADIYSLGITFWELASRKIPYFKDTQAAIPTFVQQGEREDIPVDCPEKLAHLIQQCWEGSPEARPSAADIARFMTTDAKTLKEVEAPPKSPALESACYQLTSQVLSSFMPYQDNLNSELSGFNNLQVTPPASSLNSPTVVSLNVTPKRRGSNILNLTDKKGEQEKIQYVLEQLRTFFLEDREEGERTENYDIYNEYLKKASKDNTYLVYKPKQNKHMLYVKDEPLDAEAAAREISKMLKSLAIISVPAEPMASPTVQSSVTVNARPIQATPQAVSPTAAPVPKPNLPEQKNASEPAMLTQFQAFTKPAPQVSASDLTAFLRFVAEGEQDKVEAMLKSNPALALVPGDITDLSKRTFTNITGFQYAVWALDWHMWTMIRKYLPDDAAREQAEEFETGSWVKIHGVHVNLNILIQAYKTTIDLYNAKKYTEGNTSWVQQVGGAQLLLPAHVVNEYCHPTRPFYPLPNFKDTLILPRSRTTNGGEWFTASYSGGTLGEKFACYRGLGIGVLTDAERRSGAWSGGGLDHESIIILTNTRITQREELIAELRLGHVQRHIPQNPMVSSITQSSTSVNAHLIQATQFQAISTALTPVSKPNLSEQKNPSVMLTQLNQALKPTSKVSVNLKVNADELKAFLRLVAEGEQDKAEVMLKSNAALALVSGDVTDLSKRTFTNITGFQYAVWALDWHMWTMIRKYLPDNEAKQQAEGFETDTWVRQHGVHAQHLLDNLLKALQTTIDLYELKKWDEGNKAWVQQVGGTQRLLPVHVVNEYCHPRRSFDPRPNFRDPLALPRSRMIVDKLEWFTAKYNGGELGDKFAIYRGQYAQASSMWVCSLWRGRPASQLGQAGIEDFIARSICEDHNSLSELIDTRIAQREELIAELKPRLVQKKAA